MRPPTLPRPKARDAIGVLVADDNETLRHLLKQCVEALPAFGLLGVASDGKQALEMVARLRPRVALIDLHMPGPNGLQTMVLIREFYPATRVVIVSADDSLRVKAICLARGADGFVAKRWLFPELRDTMSRLFPSADHALSEETPAEPASLAVSL